MGISQAFSEHASSHGHVHDFMIPQYTEELLKSLIPPYMSFPNLFLFRSFMVLLLPLTVNPSLTLHGQCVYL